MNNALDSLEKQKNVNARSLIKKKKKKETLKRSHAGKLAQSKLSLSVCLE